MYWRAGARPGVPRAKSTQSGHSAVKFVATGVRPEVRIGARDLGETVRIKVQDNGIGIAPEHQGRIFGLFERLHTKEAYPGTGVGLAIVKRAIERSGGRVGVNSTPGQGSTFWFELPK